MRLSVLSVWLALFTVGEQYVLATCECGYTVNSTDTTNSNANYALFTDLLETDFLHLYNLPTSIFSDNSEAVGWAPQAYNVSPSAARGPYGKSSEVDNVVLNPLNSTFDWGSGDGMIGGPPGLQLWVRGVNNLSDYVATDPSERGKMVRVAEIDSLRDDIRYGSFRIGMKMAEVEGTCAAFFWYRNNTQEIDLEYLSRQSYASNSSSKINLVIQSPLSAALNYNAASTTTFTLHSLPFLPGLNYHEYRFDWTPTSISFYADGIYLASFDQYDPNAEGTLMLNHWSNGDANWSGGPPDVDTAITVSYIKAYFNTSNESRNEQWRDACADDWEGRTCEIPSFPAQGISPLGDGGNETGKTEFFMYRPEDQGAVVNQTVYPAATALPSGGDKVELIQSRMLAVAAIAAAAMMMWGRGARN